MNPNSFKVSLMDLFQFIFISGNERSQIAHVTFKDPQGAETAVLLSV